jgi:zinc protease
VVNPLVFAGEAYGHPAGGSPQSLARITRADVQALHARWYRPDNATLILAGDVTPEAGFALAERYFGGWTKPATRLPRPVVAARPPSAPSRMAAPGPRVVVVDMPDSGQAAVYFARRGPSRGDRAYTAAEVADSVLGGGYSARLNQEVRIRRGLSYGARSFLDARRSAGLLGAVIQTKNESADEVVDVLLGELARLGTEPVSAAELGPRKAVLVGGFGRELETGGGLAGLLSDLALHGRPLSEIGRYLSGVESVTPEQIQRYAGPGLSPEGATIIVVGDAKAFEADLRRKFPRTEVIPAAQLNLDSPTLR